MCTVTFKFRFGGIKSSPLLDRPFIPLGMTKNPQENAAKKRNHSGQVTLGILRWNRQGLVASTLGIRTPYQVSTGRESY